ncbi:MAG: ABC transporter permease [Alphaproteobacteria bacterium]|nr:ABC transporter permease [Alphaproteobacteria bacterium]NNF23914.1 FtsX-like permease family protein [Paracoccaceae bacterium]
MVSPLQAKLLRHLWHIKGQAIAIALVIGMGVALQVMMSGLVLSLSTTRDAYYERFRLADAFAPVSRAPDPLIGELARIPGVATAEARIVGAALVDIDGRDLPVTARAISLPDDGSPKLNAVLLTAGRMIDPSHPEEILLLDGFAAAHRLAPGDRIQTTMNGRRRTHLVVGTVQSPEFIYFAAPGELIPDDARFGVIWMGREALAAVFDLRGSFNEALLSMTRNAQTEAVLDAADRILSAYGGPGAYSRDDQFSNRFVSEEISGLAVSASRVPPVFLAVAAFLLNIVVGRLVQSERNEIGLMKAFGYSNREVGWHYMQLVLAIAIGGALLGCLIGIVAGRAIIPLYTIYYKFPFLIFRLDAASFIIGVATSIVVASAGGLLVLRSIFRLAPAEAMRPPAPADYSGSGRLISRISRHLDQPTRMVLRRVTRYPWRMAGAVVGIAAGMGLSLGMLIIYSGFDEAMDRTFNWIDRSDATVTFVHPVSDKTVLELRRMPGVFSAEPIRHVPVILRNGRNSHQGAIVGLAPEGHLYRALGTDLAPVPLPDRGVVLSATLAGVLDLGIGDTMTIDVREGAQPIVEAPVTGIAQVLIGAPAFMDLAALNQLLGEASRVSGAHLAIDPARENEVHAALKDMPMVAGVSLRAEAERAFRKVMNQGAGSARYIMGAMAFAITFGIIYNAARVAQAERARDLASLQVMGFRRSETAFVLLGELAIVTLAALPLGLLIGRALSFGIAEGFSTELYQIPVVFDPRAQGIAISVVVGASLASGWLVKRDIDRADIIEVLKTNE